MKRVIQLILFLFLIFISFIFYQNYFKKNTKVQIKSDQTKGRVLETTENNLIKNLKYEVTLDQDNQYIITSNLSEITYENNIEVVKMQTVKAIFKDKTNIPILITSEEATYNNDTHNTNFSKNVKISYLNNLILSDKMDLNFADNLILIYENVKYDGLQGAVKADNVKINLITKKIEIYMDNDKDKVEVETKN